MTSVDAGDTPDAGSSVSASAGGSGQDVVDQTTESDNSWTLIGAGFLLASDGAEPRASGDATLAGAEGGSASAGQQPTPVADDGETALAGPDPALVAPSDGAPEADVAPGDLPATIEAGALNDSLSSIEGQVPAEAEGAGTRAAAEDLKPSQEESAQHPGGVGEASSSAPQVEPAAEPLPAPAPEPDVSSASAPEPETEAAPEPETEAAPEPETEAAPEPETEAAPESVPVAESEAVPEPVPAAEAEAPIEPAPVPEPEATPEPVPVPEPVATPAPIPERNPAPIFGPTPEPEATPPVAPMPESTAPEAVPVPEPDAPSAVPSEPEPDTQPVSAPLPEPDATPAPLPEPEATPAAAPTTEPAVIDSAGGVPPAPVIPEASPASGGEEAAPGGGSEASNSTLPETIEPNVAEGAAGSEPDSMPPSSGPNAVVPSVPFDALFAVHGEALKASLVDSFVLPDSEVAAGIAGGFTCTGLDRNFDGSWIVASDGRTDRGDTTFEPSIEFLDAGFAKSLGHIALAPLYEGIRTVQGVSIDPTDGTIWFVDKANAMIRHITQDGTPLREDDIDVSGIVPNGLAYDSDRGGLWVSAEGTSSAFCLSTEDGSQLATVGIGADTDHLFYDATYDRLYFTYGANGREGSISAVDVETDTLIGGFHGLEKAQAIEGLYIDGDTFYLANDAGFHDEVRAGVNMILKFQIVDPLAEAPEIALAVVEPDPFAI